MSSGLPTGCPGVDGALSVNPISRNAISLHLVAGMLRSRDHFFGLGLGLGLTVIGLGLGLGLMR